MWPSLNIVFFSVIIKQMLIISLYKIPEEIMRRPLRIFIFCALALFFTACTADVAPTVKVYKHVDWGCCDTWIDHLRVNGFSLEPVNVLEPDEYRQRLGIPRELASCHFAEVGDYVVGGHVPAEDINRLLDERPDALGLAVGGMPAGSPGMEGDRKDPYDVLLLKKDGTSSVFQSYRWSTR